MMQLMGISFGSDLGKAGIGIWEAGQRRRGCGVGTGVVGGLTVHAGINIKCKSYIIG
jgi:hypothetical protein